MNRISSFLPSGLDVDNEPLTRAAVRSSLVRLEIKCPSTSASSRNRVIITFVSGRFCPAKRNVCLTAMKRTFRSAGPSTI